VSDPSNDPVSSSETADATPAGGRHRGREVALQVLYAIDLGESGPRDAAAARKAKVERGGFEPYAEQDAARSLVDVDPEEASGVAFDRITEHFDVPGTSIDFARELVAGIAKRVAELDELIGLHAKNWRVSRMAAVDRNVLRLGVYELRETETPVAVVIDEAVDLARRFGGDTSPSFVNGVLDAVAREVRAA